MKRMNWHQKHEARQGIGVKFALKFVKAMGTIQFVAIFNVVVVVWVIFNVWALFVAHWDPYPFILLNLFFSWQASNAASFILIAQNDQAARDKVQAEHQYDHQESELQLQTAILQRLDVALAEHKSILEELRNRSA